MRVGATSRLLAALGLITTAEAHSSLLTAQSRPPATRGELAATAPSHPGRPTNVWLSFVPFQGSSIGGQGGAGALHVQHGHFVMGLQAASHEEPGDSAAYYPRGFDVGLQFGYASRAARRVHISVTMGPSIGEYHEVVTFGLPLETRVTWRPTGFVGLGLAGWVGMRGRPDGFGVAVQLGDLR
jgi:hypothetical protein